MDKKIIRDIVIGDLLEATKDVNERLSVLLNKILERLDTLEDKVKALEAGKEQQ